MVSVQQAEAGVGWGDSGGAGRGRGLLQLLLIKSQVLGAFF